MNVKFIVRNQISGTNLYLSSPKAFDADGPGVFSFKQSDVFSNIALQPGVTYSIGFISDGVQNVRCLTGSVPDQNGIILSGYTVITNYAVPGSGGFGAEKFSLRLVGPSAPAPVPTLSEWAMILLGLMLAGGAALTIQRRRAA